MTILILIGMAVLVGVLLLYVFELGRSRRLLLKAGNARKALRSSEELFRSIMQNVHASFFDKQGFCCYPDKLL